MDLQAQLEKKEMMVELLQKGMLEAAKYLEDLESLQQKHVKLFFSFFFRREREKEKVKGKEK